MPRKKEVGPGIYQIRNLITGERYIGHSRRVTFRFRDHRKKLNRGYSGCGALQDAWGEYTREAFVFEVLEPLPAAEKSKLREREDFWLALAADLGWSLYNSHRSSTGKGYKHTEQVKEMAAIRREGRPKLVLSAETRAKISKANKGRRLSPEVIARQVASRKGYRPSEETKMRISAANKGRVVSDATRALIGAKSRAYFATHDGPNKGRTFGPEFGEKISRAKLGQSSYVRTEEQKLEQSRRGKERWAAIKASPDYRPIPPMPCAECGRPKKPLRKGLCSACYARKTKR